MDKEIGLYYYRARYYDANIGRFISRDPIGQVDQINLYTYVKNNPINYTDPMGLASKAIVKIYNDAGVKMQKFRNENEWSWWKNDWDPDLNLYYFNKEYKSKFNEDSGEYDLAYGGMGISNEYDNDKDGNVTFDGEIINLGQISNVLAALNAYRLGFSKEHLEYWAMKTVELGQGNGVEGEKADQILYDYGYKLGELEKKNGSLTEADIIKYVKDATKARKNYLDNQNK